MQEREQTPRIKTATLAERAWPSSIEMTAMTRAMRGTDAEQRLNEKALIIDNAH